jgi:hypothetical protein
MTVLVSHKCPLGEYVHVVPAVDAQIPLELLHQVF